MAEPAAIKYAAFLSYSHADEAWTRKLQARLENHPIGKEIEKRLTAEGPIVPKPGTIFRDRTDYTAGQSLNELTRAALDASAALVVVCSPHAATSHWVNEEIRLFRARHPDRRVIPIILDGEPPACFPPALAYVVAADGQVTGEAAHVLAADARKGKDGQDLALAKVVAALVGSETDEVYNRALRAKLARQRTWLSMISVLAVVLAGLLFLAEISREQAERNLGVAKTVTNKMAFDIINELRDLKGIKSATVEAIIKTAQDAVENLQPVPLETRIRRTLQSIRDWVIPPAKAEDAGLERTRAGLLMQEAMTKFAKGDIDGAERMATDAAAIYRRLLAKAPGDVELTRELSVALNKIGEARHGKGNAAGAATAFKESLAIMERLAGQFPDRPLIQRDNSVPLIWLGNLALAAGQIGEAEALYAKALALLDKARSADLAALGIPERAARAASIDKDSLDRERTVALNKLGDAATARGDTAGALAFYEKSRAERQLLAAANPDDALLERQQIIASSNLGMTRYAAKDFAGAAESFSAAVAGWRARLKADPDNESRKGDLSVELNHLGAALLDSGRVGDARAAFAEDLEITRALTAKDRGNVQRRQELLTSLIRMAQVSLTAPPDVYRACKSIQEATQLQTQGTAIAPDASQELARLREFLTSNKIDPVNCPAGS